MWRSFNAWLDSLPDRTIDRVSIGVLVAAFLVLTTALALLIVVTAV